MTKKHAFADCDNCPLQDRPYVPSTIPDDIDVVIVGEAPGYYEARKGKPFVGKSGELLDTVLSHAGIDRAKALMTNAVACHPKDNETPTKKAITACGERLMREIDSSNSVPILSLGSVASSAIMAKSVKITSFRAGPPKQSSLYPGRSVVPTIHPASCLRTPDNFPHLVTDIEKITKPIDYQWDEPVFKVFTKDNARLAVEALLKNYDTFVIDIETAYEKDAAYVQANHYELLCIGVGYAPGKVAVFDKGACADPTFRKYFARLLKEKRIICHNGKFDLSGLATIGGRGIQLYGDSMLASYCLDERSGVHGLKYLAAELLGLDDYASALKQYTGGPSGSFAAIPPDTLHKYNAYDVAATWAIWGILEKQLEEQGLRQLHNYLVDISNVVRQIEMDGIKIDFSALELVRDEMSVELDKREKDMYHWVDNPRSPMQVKKALADDGVDVDSTDREHLEAILEHKSVSSSVKEFVTLLLEYRKIQKLYGTYVKGLEKRLYNGRIHSNFSLHGTTTGRLASRNPNLLNIPRGSTIKSLFVPDFGNVFIQADYSQIEFRVVATLAEEPYLKEIFDDPNRDVFGELAADMFGPSWSKHHRQIVKRIVHGTNYGMGAGTMAAQINSDASNFGVNVKYDEHGADLRQKQYLDRIPQVKKWQKAVQDSILKDQNDLVTPFGRHRRFWLITKENKFDIIHEGLAYVPQSTASDICLGAVLELHDRLPQGSAIRLSVYDSIMVEAPQDDVEKVVDLMRDCMVGSAQRFSDYTKFAVDISTSNKSWGEL